MSGSCHESSRAVATPTAVTSIALDDTYLYFVRQGTGIQRVTKASTGETPVTVVGDTTAYGLAIHGGAFFWTDANGVYTCPVTGCVGAPTAVSDLPSGTGRIVVDDTHFFWTTTTATNMCAQTGCNDAPIRMTTQYLTAMAPGPSSLFVVSQSYPYGVTSISTIDPPNSTLITTTLSSSSGLAYAAGKVYWINGSAVSTCDPTNCVAEILATVPFGSTAGQMAADDTAVLWAADGIHETVLATGTDSVIANIHSNVTQLALDTTNVYWAATDGVYWAAR